MNARAVSAGGMVLLSLLSCISSAPPASEDTGAVEGMVTDGDSVPLSGCTACIQGTNLCASTDSAGGFLILAVPAGTWPLAISAPIDTTVLVVVKAGETADAGIFAPDPCAGVDMKFAIYNAPDSGAIAAPWLASDPYPTARHGRTTVIYCDADSLLFGVMADPEAGPVTIACNGVVLCSDCSPKGRLLGQTLQPVFRTGNDTVVFSTARDPLCAMTVVLLDKAYLDSVVANRVLVTTGSVTLAEGPCGSPAMNVALDSQIYCIRMGTVENVDWDIYFVNDSAGDTCCWADRAPCWDTTPGCARSPRFGGDQCQLEPAAFGSWAQLGCDKVSADQIRADSLIDGVYSIYVNYFYSPPESTTATPNLVLELGRKGPSNLIERIFTAAPPRPMRKGETWFAGRVFLPERKFVPEETITAAGLAKRAKAR